MLRYFFDDENGTANIQVEPNVKMTQTQIDAFGDNFDTIKNGFVDFLLLDNNGKPFVVLEAKSEDKDPLVGKEQAREASKKLKEIIKDGSIKFYVSPYLRSRQTYDNLMLNFKENRTSFVYDPRLREQEFGNFHHIEEETFEEMRKVGKFYYRFTNGENGADVYDRASLFLDSLFREIKDIDYKKYDNIVIVCHGLFMRLFMMNFLKYTIEQFDLLATPHNCEFWIIEKNERGKYQLISELKNEENNLN